ncbi:biliverdin-producing heme oxygenase [Sphingomonas sp. GB1N7]|uniref:biliverdin-producing heme oxygenase n=1 Tax=Parasphingomonas caseinilytica TaxID=3096158 RepID=UPI002FC69434
MSGAREALRRETRDCHDRVDAVYSTFRLDTREGYGAFLAAQAAAHIPCEAALDHAQAERIVPDWPMRRRAALLMQDLAGIGFPASAFRIEPQFETEPAVLGAIYVLEGSRLGGAMLVRSVPTDLPHRFLGASVPGAWRNLMQFIDARLRSDAEIGEAVAAARTVFGLFERAGQASMKVA